MEDLPKSLDGLCSLDSYLRVNNSIKKFITDEIHNRHPDIIVTIARKSGRILDTLFESNKACGIRIIEDGRISFSDIDGKKVMIFDDSIHTGDSVKKCIELINSCGNPNECYVVSLLCNSDAVDYLSEVITKNNIISYREFSDYKQQQDEFISSILPLVVGADNKLGREFVSEVLELNCDCQFAETLFVGIFERYGYTCAVHSDEISEYRGNKNLTFTPSDACDGDNGTKIRMNIFPRNEKTYAVLEYFVVTEIDENQESCLRKEKIIRVCDYSDEDERTCLKCIVLDLSIKYIRKFHDDVMETLDHNGVMIGVPVFNLPAKEKYPRDIILNPDIFRQETK